MYFDYFVLPFTVGLNILIIYLIVLYSGWIRKMEKEDKEKIRKNIFSLKTIKAIGEIFLESLLHRKIFRVNPILGFMHSAFAFGWFLLIVVGKLEVSFCCSDFFNPPYYAIFFRFFEPANESFPFQAGFAFLMDLILLYILLGLILALIKRVRSRLLGMKSTSKLKLFDKIAMMSLWMIFPLRFFAESFSCGLNGTGSFLTNNAGIFFDSFLPLDKIAYPAWWAYSLSLCFFFLALPFSRYMHIPTEMIYIFLKNMGIKQGKKFTSFTNFPLYSCSRCGICLDQCQLNTSLGNKDSQSVYFLQKLRNKEDFGRELENCLQCGKCEKACPVGIDLMDIRLSQKKDKSVVTKKTYSYIGIPGGELTDIAYFSGCMGHLTPGVEKSMINIFERAGVKFSFVDKEKGICCGRPLKLAGQHKAASVLIKKNTEIIENTGAKLLVTSCPICYKVFKEDYNLSMRVLHHTEFLHELVGKGVIGLRKKTVSYTYHDPCELSRNNPVYKEPRELLSMLGDYKESEYSKDKSLCCGGGLANTHISQKEKTKVSQDVVKLLSETHMDVIVTSCPLCKKTLEKARMSEIKDISEVFAEGIK